MSFLQDDTALNHAACKTIENLLLVADKQADKLATPDIALALWNISSTVGNNEYLRACALTVNIIQVLDASVYSSLLPFISLGSLPYGFILSRCCSICH